MSRPDPLGFHQPGDGWLYRLPVGWKYLLMLTLTLVPVLTNVWWVTVLFLTGIPVLLASTGIGPRRSLAVGWPLVILLALLMAFHLLTGHTHLAVTAAGGILCAVLAARVLTLTTPQPELLDALARFLRPLRHLGVNPRRVALSVSLMLRSIPFLLGSIGDARDAARARGMDRRPHRLLLPVALGTVAYADRTAEALQARGLTERRHAADT